MLDAGILTKNWKDITFVAFDTETSGAFPVGNEIVEMGAVKWRNGEILDRFQVLLKPSVPMTDFIIGIHGITNEMVADAPKVDAVLAKFMEFLGDAVLVAHHAPFDLGFLVYDLERLKMKIPTAPVLCTSLLARRLIPESPNHKLQTLVGVLELGANTAHRALDDAISCQRLAEVCFKRCGDGASLVEVVNKMGKKLAWNDYLLQGSGSPILIELMKAIQNKKDVDFIYDSSGVNKGITRRMTPIGIVRSPDGDFIQGLCHIDHIPKRFYVSRVKELAATL